MNMQNQDRKKVKLWDIIKVKHWWAFKWEFFSDRWEYILLTPWNFTETDGLILKWDKEKYYIWTFPQEYMLKKWDLLIAMTDLKQSAPYLWAPWIVPQNNLCLHNQRLWLVQIIKEDIVDKWFLYYVFNDDNYRSKVRGSATGSTVKHTAPERIYSIHILLPKLLIQKKIASILKNYDNLIENNNQRIKLLEQEAELIYKEWFVKFNFPWHEKIKMVNSWTELGWIPEWWEVKKIGEIFITILWWTPSREKDEYRWGDIPWINSWKTNELRIINESEFITSLWLKKSSAKLMPKRTTVLAITGATLWQVSLLEIEACWNQSVVWVYDNDWLYNSFIFLKIKEIINSIISNAWWWAQQHINKDTVNDTKILLPTKNLIEDMKIVIDPIFDEIRDLLITNINLKKTRDILLPKLISWEVEV